MYVCEIQGFLVSWFLAFLVSKFLGFKVDWFLGFKVSWLLGFKVPQIYHMSMSCVLEDIDPISKISKNSLDGSSGFSESRLLQSCRKALFSIF